MKRFERDLFRIGAVLLFGFAGTVIYLYFESNTSFDGFQHQKWLNLSAGRFALPPAAGEVRLNSDSLFDHSLPNLKTEPIVPLIIDSTLEDSARSKELLCPKWEAYDKRIQLNKDFRDNCTILPSTSNNFTITLCESTRFCGQGYFLVSRTDKSMCDSLLQMTVSHNPILDQYFKKKLGPDAFQLIFDGPQRETPSLWTHLGDCEYKLPFRLTNPGHYTVQLINTYDYFKAVDEVIEDVWPKPVYKQLLAKDFMLEVCSWCPKYSSLKLEKILNGELPACGRTEPQQGVFLRMTNETERERDKLKMYGKPYIWEPLGCRIDQNFELFSNKSCHGRENRSILVMGDSQARILAWALDRRFSANKEPLNKHSRKYQNLHKKYFASKTNSTTGSSSNQRGRTEMLFRSDEHMSSFINVAGYRSYDKKLNLSETEKLVFPFDTVVFTLAHWPGSAIHKGGHFSVERYVDLLEHVANWIEVINQRRVRMQKKQPIDFIWMGVNAFTINPNLNVPHAKSIDWRINYRLKVWSDYAEKVFRQKGLTIMNSFDITLPWSQDTIDGAHFHATPAMDAQVDEVLHKLNICGVKNGSKNS
ncbi:hypothetical protein BCR33DRAFT_719019 [Rhizoclosmatium globosum]|uniref:Uncharacterized protein n=1 Tax=Rhizoclosmatium globosum TaxID=329046 RepID=A0A1Y2C1Z8_9FUNG|nr:hypothetical protein BCR33DRAFT_719019 [Rhizoclosmatium globosum]|eukprot:ORY40907.1 hypothetical protein BCR33DRAFT_719019 [Rhizoclosmatium globosum]